MAGAEPITSIDGTVPYIATSSQDWGGWFGLNADVAEISPRAGTFDMSATTEEQGLVLLSSRYQETDWATEADWYKPKEHWRGWIPVKDPEGVLPTPPFLDFNDTIPYVTFSDGSFKMDAAHIQGMRREMVALDETVLTLVMAEFEGVKLAPIPEPVNHLDLTDSYYKTPEDLQRAGSGIRRGIADRLGWIAWALSAVPRDIWKVNLNRIEHRALDALSRTMYRRRGYLLRPYKDWMSMNVSLWLSHSIPIYYQWSFEDSMSPNLARLNPKIVAAYTSDDRIQLHYVEEDHYFEEAAINSQAYDDFAQPRVFDENLGSLSFETDAVFYIIDFQHWKRRELPIDSDFAEYRAALGRC